MLTRRPIIAAALCLLSLASAGRADEGMWLFNKLPLETLAEKYDFKTTEKWIDHVSLA